MYKPDPGGLFGHVGILAGVAAIFIGGAMERYCPNLRMVQDRLGLWPKQRICWGDGRNGSHL
jgi:hypothetical protein